jgi:sugar lactone lactonase YvrE
MPIRTEVLDPRHLEATAGTMSVHSTGRSTRWRLLAEVAAMMLALPAVLLMLLAWRRAESCHAEPCYAGRPLSYWRQQLQDWRIMGEPDLEIHAEGNEQNAEGMGPEFQWVPGTPGRWDLRKRVPVVQLAKADLTYGEPSCRLPIIEGARDAIPVLTALLDDEDLCIRRLAASGLGTIGPPARVAFPALLLAIHQDQDPFLRGIARTALLDINKEAAQKAGIVDHFIFWSPQPRLCATIRGSFFLHSPKSVLAGGKILAWDDRYHTVSLRERASGKVLATFAGPADCAWPIVFSPDGKTVASASRDKKGMVRVWDLATGKTQATLRRHTGAIDSLAFSPDGKTLASGSRDNTVMLWDVSNGKNTGTLQGHTSRVSAVAFSPDGRLLASGDDPAARKLDTVKVWNVSTRTELASLLHEIGPALSGVTCLAFSPDGKTLASGSRVSQVMLVDVVSGKKRAMLDEYESSGSLGSVAFSPDGRTLAYVSWDKIFIYDVATGKKISKIPADPGDVDAATFTPDGRLLAVTREKKDHTERLWEFAATPGGRK